MHARKLPSLTCNNGDGRLPFCMADVFFRFRSLSPIVSNPDLQNIEGGDERTPEQQPRPYSPSFVQGDRTVRVVKLQASTSSVVDNNLTWLDVCWHLYHALCELIAWQAGEAEADGEIPLRESVAFEDALGGLPANSATRQRFKQCARSTPGYKTKTSSAHYMEKDEVSFDRDNARRRRVSKLAFGSPSIHSGRSYMHRISAKLNVSMTAPGCRIYYGRAILPSACSCS